MNRTVTEYPHDGIYFGSCSSFSILHGFKPEAWKKMSGYNSRYRFGPLVFLSCRLVVEPLFYDSNRAKRIIQYTVLCPDGKISSSYIWNVGGRETQQQLDDNFKSQFVRVDDESMKTLTLEIP